jgi:hypothetical protein
MHEGTISKFIHLKDCVLVGIDPERQLFLLSSPPPPTFRYTLLHCFGLFVFNSFKSSVYPTIIGTYDGVTTTATGTNAASRQYGVEW